MQAVKSAYKTRVASYGIGMSYLNMLTSNGPNIMVHNGVQVGTSAENLCYSDDQTRNYF